MSRFSRVLAVLATALLCLALATPARAGIDFSFDKTVAAGAAFDSLVQRTGGTSAISCFATNSDGATARTVLVKLVADDQTRIAYSVSVSVAASTTVGISIGIQAVAAAGVTPIPVVPTRYLQLTAVAAGSSNLWISCVGR